jgi:hypothetical protein
MAAMSPDKAWGGREVGCGSGREVADIGGGTTTTRVGGMRGGSVGKGCHPAQIVSGTLRALAQELSRGFSFLPNQDKGRESGRNENRTGTPGSLPGRANHTSLAFHPRFRCSAMLDPCQQISPFGFKHSRSFHTESNMSSCRQRAEQKDDENTVVGR